MESESLQLFAGTFEITVFIMLFVRTQNIRNVNCYNNVNNSKFDEMVQKRKKKLLIVFQRQVLCQYIFHISPISFSINVMS